MHMRELIELIEDLSRRNLLGGMTASGALGLAGRAARAQGTAAESGMIVVQLRTVPEGQPVLELRGRYPAGADGGRPAAQVVYRGQTYPCQMRCFPRNNDVWFWGTFTPASQTRFPVKFETRIYVDRPQTQYFRWHPVGGQPAEPRLWVSVSLPPAWTTARQADGGPVAHQADDPSKPERSLFD